MMNTPFSDMVRHLNQVKGLRYIDMQMKCNEARSSAWWNNVANRNRVAPPPPETINDIAKMMALSSERVASMIAEEWYGVEAPRSLSPRMQRLEPLVEELSEKDAELIESLAKRLRGLEAQS